MAAVATKEANWYESVPSKSVQTVSIWKVSGSNLSQNVPC